MVMTFTVSLRVARADHLQVREMLIGAIGCNLAWGIIDGIMYVMCQRAWTQQQGLAAHTQGEECAEACHTYLK